MQNTDTITSKTTNDQDNSRRSALLASAAYWLPALGLLAIVFACFGRTLSSFFLADDIGEIAYVARIFHGHPELFWANFTGNYMHVASMSVYRPWLFMTLFFDYVFWHTNAFGYYLSNLLYYAGCVVLLYSTSLKLTKTWGKWRSILASYFGSALFAVSPLHCESISWVVGRVDIASCFYYLLSFYCLLLSRETGKKLYGGIAVVSFWLGLFVKEMAIGLPALAAAFGFLFPIQEENTSLGQRLKSAWSFSFPLWASTVIYFVLRFLALGTIFGGYTGSIGASQLSHVFERWLDPDTLHRIAFPFTSYLFTGTSIWPQALTICYLAALGLIFFRLAKGELSARRLAFLVVWLVTCAVPIYQLWGLGYNLEGSRFCFFLTMPLSLLLPWLLFEPGSGRNKVVLSGLACLVLTTMVAILYRTAYATNSVWLQAGKEVRQLFIKSQELAASCPQDGKYIILGLPTERGGTHMILNGDTYRMMLSPPFIDQDTASHFLTFAPFLFGSSDLLNSSRFKACLSDPHTIGVFQWKGKEQGFVKLPITAGLANQQQILLPQADASQVSSLGHASAKSEDGFLELTHIANGDGIKFTGLSINPSTVDFAEFDLADLKANVPLAIKAYWNTDSVDSPNQAVCLLSPSRQTSRHIAIRLSGNWHWFTQGKIEDITLSLPPIEKAKISNFKLTLQNQILPILEAPGETQSNTGFYQLSDKPFAIALSNPNKKAVVVEISQPDCFFENYEPAKQAQLVAHKDILVPGQSSFIMSGKYTARPGFYQIRASYQNSDPVYSDPITVFRPNH